MRKSIFFLPVLFFPILILLSVMYFIPSAEAKSGVHCVTPDGTGCDMGICDYCYDSMQSAVDAAVSGEEIRVAAGTYSGTTTIYPENAGEGYTQVVLIYQKSLIFRGGYDTSDWTTSDPESNETKIDAGANGRGVTVIGSGSETVTVDGFTITNGDYTGLGNGSGENWACSRTGSDCGGGLFARYMTFVLKNSIVSGCTASTTSDSSDGGGVYLWIIRPGTQIDNVTISNNVSTANDSFGGGLSLKGGSGVSITMSTFTGNSCNYLGGGIGIFQPTGPVSIEDCVFSGNTVSAAGGNFGGGAIGAALVYTGATALSVNRVRMDSNKADNGACVSLTKQGPNTTQVEMDNLILSNSEVYNAGATKSSLIYANGNADNLEVAFNHLTVADNNAPTFLYGEGPYSSGYQTTVTLNNTIINGITNAFVGKEAVGGGDVIINYTSTLRNNVTNLEVSDGGTPTFNGLDTLSGDPLLNATYHLQVGSPAINTGVDSGVATDIDGDSRPKGSGYDIGADEFFPKGNAAINLLLF